MAQSWDGSPFQLSTRGMQEEASSTSFSQQRTLGFPSTLHRWTLQRGTQNTLYSLQSTVEPVHIFLKIVTRKCEHKTGERAPRPGSVLTRCPQKGNLPHIREEWSKYHLHTALYHRRKTNRNAKHGSQHEFPFKNSRSTRGTVPNCGWR